jgi:abequosyltransferase
MNSDLNMPLLSLCVPTYNRAAMLTEALNAILSQWESDLSETQRGNMEVLVFDNHSSDGTPEVLARIQSEFPCLRLTYIRQPQNLGAGTNIVQAIGKAGGAYVFVLSDDDILLPGALSRVFTLAQQYPDVDAFCLNASTFLHDVQEAKSPVFTLSEDRMIKEPDEALLFLGTWITFLSILVFRREAIAGKDYTNRIATDFPHSYCFLDVLSRRNGVLITKDAFLAVRGNNTGGYNFFAIFVTNFKQMLLDSLESGYSPQAVRQVLRRHLRTFLFPFILSFKRSAFGSLTLNYRDGANRLLRAYGINPFLIFAVMPLLFAPPALIRAGFALRRSLKLMKAKSGKS